MRTKQRGIILSWILSYFVVFLVPTSVVTYAFFYSVSQLGAEAEENSIASLKLAANQIDNVIEMMQDAAANLAGDENILSFSENYDSISSEAMLKIVNDINNNAVMSNYFRTAYIYFDRSGIVLGNKGKYMAETYYKLHHSGGSMTYEQWIDLLRSYTVGTYKNELYTPTSGTAEYSTLYVKSLPFGEPQNMRAAVVFVLNNNWLSQTLKEGWSSKRICFIANENDEIIASSKNAKIFETMPYREINGSGRGNIKFGGKKYSTYCIGSSVNLWKYYLVYTDNDLFDKYFPSIMVFILIYILLVVLIVCVIAANIKKNYRSLNKVVGVLSNDLGIDIDLHTDVYDDIARHLHTSFSKSKDIIERQRERLKINFLNKLLYDSNMTDIEIKEGRDYLGESFFGGNIRLVLCCITESPDYADEYGTVVIDNIFTEIISEKYPVIGNVTEDSVIFLVSADQDFEAFITEKNKFAAELIKREFSVSFITSVSESGELKNVSDMYSQARYTLESAASCGKNNIVFYSDVTVNKTAGLSKSLAVWQQYINLMQTGKYSLAFSVIKPTVDILALNGSKMPDIKIRMYSLINNIIEGLNAAAGVENEKYVKKLELISQPSELKNYVYYMFNELKQLEADKENDKYGDLIQEVKSIIDKNYGDENLSIGSIADKFGMNPAYFARLFAKHTGVYMNDYINSVRLSEAKKMLTSTNKSVKDIASLAGYGNNTTFIRVFKKSEGITPSKYRELNK